MKNYIEIESGSNCRVLSSFNSRTDSIKIECRCGDVFFTTFAYFKNKGNRKQQCDNCGLRKSNEEFLYEVAERFPHLTVLEKYKGSLNKILFECKTHGNFISCPNNVLQSDYGCKKCGHIAISKKMSKDEHLTCIVCGSNHRLQRFNNETPYCAKHYNQMRRYGEIKERTQADKNEIILHEEFAEIILRDRQQNEVGRSSVSLDKVNKIKDYKWYLSNNGYVGSRTNGKPELLHRVIMNASKDQMVDHIDRNRSNNLTTNLRIVNQSQNSMNSSISKRNTSGVTGVWYCKLRNNWVAEIFVNGKKYSLGRSKEKEEAIKLRKEAEENYFGEYAPKHKEEKL